MKRSALKKQKLLAALLLLACTLTIISQSLPAVLMMQSQQNGLLTRNLVLPSDVKNENEYGTIGTWALTLQLVIVPANEGILHTPETVATALGKLLKRAAFSHGLELVGITALEPSTQLKQQEEQEQQQQEKQEPKNRRRRKSHNSRGLKSQQEVDASSSSSSLLLAGSVNDYTDEAIDEAVENSKDANYATSSHGGRKHIHAGSRYFYMRAVLASSLPSVASTVATIVRLANVEVVALREELISAGFPVASIEVVSLAPHEALTPEQKFQVEQLITQEKLATGGGEFEFVDDSILSFLAISVRPRASSFSAEFWPVVLAGLVIVVVVVSVRRKSNSKGAGGGGQISIPLSAATKAEQNALIL